VFFGGTAEDGEFEDEFGGFGEIFGGHTGDAFRGFAEEDGQRAPCVVPRFHVGDVVADHDGRGQVQAQFARRHLQHPGFGFTAFAVIFRDVGAIVESVQFDFVFRQQVDHAFVAGVDLGFRAHAASDDRLIADDDKIEAAGVEEFQGIDTPGSQLHLCGVGQVVDVFDDRAVPVKKYGAILSHGGRVPDARGKGKMRGMFFSRRFR
jgi:hypothetical protein